jgi:hypothetical protein
VALLPGRRRDRAWQSWALDVPDELAASLKVTATADLEEPPSVDVYGAEFGQASDAGAMFDELFSRVGTEPTSASQQHLSFPKTRRFRAHLGEPTWDREMIVGSVEPVRHRSPAPP